MPATSASRAPDSVAAAAVEAARAAAVADAGDLVGEHLGVEADGDRVVTHLFASTAPGYRGWRWAVTVARASRAKTVTVDEVVLLPGPDALLAPEWVPWSERLRPGDLGVGDLLPTAPDDDRLVPAYVDDGDRATADPDDATAAIQRAAVEEVARELGFGRPRVLSPVGRDEAAQRWYDGEAGPHSALAKAAPAPCGTCGFWLRVAGSLGAVFGACANEFAPDDGRVVAADHGCGAHSEAAAGVVLGGTGRPRLDDAADLEVVAQAHPPGSVDEEEPAEPLGHS